MTKVYTVLTALLFSSLSFGASIQCQTNYEEYSLQIDQDTVAIRKFSDSSREVASQALASRNLPKSEGLAKVFFKNGLKYKVNIAKIGDFSEVDDYLVVTSQEGHKMTYPLTCHI